MGVYIRAIREIKERADTAAELAYNRLDEPDDEGYVDPALLAQTYAWAVKDLCTFLADGIATTDLTQVLRAGRVEGDDLPEDDPELGYPPVNRRP